MPTLPLLPSSSRSLPPLLADHVDRGRAKTRINSDPDTYAHSRTPNAATSISLPPIRSTARGSRDEECGPLPGISSIMDQSKRAYSDGQRPPRRLSESSPRAYCSSPGRERDWQIDINRTSTQAHSHWTAVRQTRMDSISTVGTDGSISRPSSPEEPCTLSSSYSTIASKSSLSSILENRSACASPGPIQLPGFAQLDSTLPPLGARASRSAFELSDLRTSLPSEEPNVRGSMSARTRAAVLRSPRSTPLPLSRPLSPVIIQPGGSPHIYPLTRRLKSLMVTTEEDRGMDQAPIDKGTDATMASRYETETPRSDKSDENETAPSPSPIKIESEAIPTPSSPASKGIHESDLLIDDSMLPGPLTDGVPSLYLNTCTVDERDENMACTPTQTAPGLQQLWTNETSPTTATATAPSTPIMRPSPLMEPSPFTASMTPPSTSSSPPDSVLRSPAPVDNEEEDSKLGIVKQSESEAEEEQVTGAGARHRERRARRRAAEVGSDASARTMPFGYGTNFMPMSMMAPITPDPVAQLAQQAEMLGFKLQPDLSRRPMMSAPSSQLVVIQQMMQRQQHIEQLQREQQEAAVGIGMSAGWPSSDLHLGPISMPDLAQPQIPLSGFAPMTGLPLPLSVQEPLDAGMMLGQDGGFDYTFASAGSPSFHSDFSGVSGSASFSASTSSLTSGATVASASSPAGSFSFMSPPPQPLPSSSTTFRSTSSQESLGPDDVGSSPAPPSQGSGTNAGTGSGTGTHKCECCGKTFRRPSGLKDHMNIHSGEKPYCCPLETCRKGFATRSNMIRHHNKTHPSRPKIGGVADINADVEDAADGAGDAAESSLASSTSSLTSASASASGSTSSQGRFRVVQQSKAAAAAVAVAAEGVGVGPMRGNKERRATRKQGLGQSAQLV